VFGESNSITLFVNIKLNQILGVTLPRFLSTLKDSDMKLLKFYTNWCNPCTQYGPIVSAVTSNMEITLEEMDAEVLNKEILDHYDIKSVPAVVLVSDSGKFKTLFGKKTATELREWITENTNVLNEDLAPQLLKEDVVNLLQTGVYNITYKKVSDNDNVHTIQATLRSNEMEQFKVEHKPDTQETKPENSNLIHFLAPERGSWRSVRVDKIISITRV
jgi:thioredoxin 1